jgi:hypothetical protein
MVNFPWGLNLGLATPLPLSIRWRPKVRTLSIDFSLEQGF